MNKPMQIGELARQSGVSPKTIRYYEEIGVLPEPARSPAGYRLYGEDDRAQLGFVLKSKSIGLTLDEIRDIAQMRDSGEPPCEHVLALVDQKIAAVEDQIRNLVDYRRELVALRTQSERLRVEMDCFCPIIEQHTSSSIDAGARPG